MLLDREAESLRYQASKQDCRASRRLHVELSKLARAYARFLVGSPSADAWKLIEGANFGVNHELLDSRDFLEANGLMKLKPHLACLLPNT